MEFKNNRYYHQLTSTVRPTIAGEKGCGSTSPNTFLCCERIHGHKGLHMAWDEPSKGRLYYKGI